jgi:hypothetical protein
MYTHMYLGSLLMKLEMGFWRFTNVEIPLNPEVTPVDQYNTM